MKHHNVCLNYEPGAPATPDPKTVLAEKGDTISFHLGTGPQGGKVRVRFDKPQLFSVAVYNHGDPDVVILDLPAHTTYQCEVLLNGKVVAHGSGQSGGGVGPGSENKEQTGAGN